MAWEFLYDYLFPQGELQTTLFMFADSLKLLFTVAPFAAVTATTIADIQGTRFTSSYAGKNVTGVTGIITAKGNSGFYLSAEPGDDVRVSNGLYVYGSTTAVVGDNISLGGKVSNYRSSSYPSYMYLVELTSPSNITVISSGNEVTPVVLGVDRSPPTQYLSALDTGSDGWLSVPNNVSQVSVRNPELEPGKYGMDFWKSLDAQLVVIPNPVALNFDNSYGEFWVRGDWEVTGLNGRGGLTLTFGEDGIPDANPEAIIVGSPLDGTKNPEVAVGTGLSNITGVISYQFGFYTVLPLTAPTAVSTPDPTVPPTTLKASTDNACSLTLGDYNVENLAPDSDHLTSIADHIANYLLSPDFMFVQEIQDNSGPTNDGTVSANITLATLSAAIADAGGVTYNFTEISPEDGKDGGQPGGNIRVAYLYNPEKLTLAPGKAGLATEAVNVTTDANGLPTLSLNPGRIAPDSSAWVSSRKPLAAEWITASGDKLFTINVHFSSKGGSTSNHGDLRPPVNSPVAQRTTQVEAVAALVQSILDIDPKANIIVSGDFNEYTQTRSVLASLNAIMTEIDEAAGIDEVERYTYVYDQNTQQLDHIFISPGLAVRGVEAEHIHVNNWAPSYDDRISDHDPTVGKVLVC